MQRRLAWAQPMSAARLSPASATSVRVAHPILWAVLLCCDAVGGDFSRSYRPSARCSRYYDVQNMLELIDCPGLDDTILNGSAAQQTQPARPRQLARNATEVTSMTVTMQPRRLRILTSPSCSANARRVRPAAPRTARSRWTSRLCARTTTTSATTASCKRC